MSDGSFPFLSPSLDSVEDLAHSRISCWVHCLRDSLYAVGFRDTVRALAQPLNFAVERTADGELLTLYGGLDTDYHAPRFQRGVSARWETSPDAEDLAFDVLERELARGHAVPVSPDLSGMRHSEFYRVPFSGYAHTFLVHALDRDTVRAADRNTRRRSGFTDNRGTVPAEELRRGLAGRPVLVWDTGTPVADWAEERRRLLARSVANLTEPGSPHEGLAGLRTLPDVVAGLEEHPSRSSVLRMRVSGPLQRQVAGDRHLLAAVLLRDTTSRDGGGRAVAAAEAAELLRASSDAYVDLARLVFLLSRSWSGEALDLCRSRVARIHDLDARAVERLAALV
ncbi:hypothetical protein AQJ66_32040 [Streptomyces bungoensis]|uniref:Butirosin biosynthesis protein H N-terminal domain-containing protein n=1 Tax=Streptomyces bungoensis TaxID=285568 RepID=A0A101SPX3_9ACTN|nr:hypothetical protein [Streptomyces bungoensis]KUN77856.1 hypothetical protein AQJ66_32040 [Streptomyces bungoensis]